MRRQTASENTNFNPTLPPGKYMKSPRKKQIEMKCQSEMRKQGIPNRRDFMMFCQIQYFRIVKLRKYFTYWLDQFRNSSSESDESFLFADFNKLIEIVDATAEEEDMITENQPEEVQNWTEVQLNIPRIQPPRRDSALKRFLRDLVSSQQFHSLQRFQAKGLEFPEIRDEEAQNDEFRRIAVDLINETNRVIDASQFFYEMYLSYLEYELHGGDEDESGPWAIIDKISEMDRQKCDDEQVQTIINYADTLLFNQLSFVIDC